MIDTSPHCFRCKKTPSEILIYQLYAERTEVAPDKYVRTEEGTYNSFTDTFCCDDCYEAIGMPTSPGGWKAPLTTGGDYQ